MTNEPPPDPDRSEVVANYRLGRQLGAGGMGTVYEATDVRSGSPVALKLLHAELAADESFRERFTREAHVASLLRSPYTVPLLDSGVEGGRYFLAMRFVEGRTVQEALRAGPFEPARALRVAAQVARSLEEAELRGIVHRDIKPDNIMLAEPGGGAQVMDFGIARQAGSSALTSTGSFIGTPLYAAPEAAGGVADARSDIYSLGATLYHMLTGGPPFAGEALDVLRQHRDTPPPATPLAALPVEISDAVLRCLAKDPAERYQSASELAGVLEQLAERATTRGDEPLATEAITVVAAQRADTGAITISLSEAEMSPAFLPGARKNSYELSLRNVAPHPVELRLAAMADAEGDADTVEIELPERVTIPSNESTLVTVQISPRRRRWRGGTRRRPFSVSVADAGDPGPPAVVSGEFEDQPERWLPYAGGAFFSVAAVAVVLTMLLGGGGGGGGDAQTAAGAPQLSDLRATVGELSLAEYFRQLETADARVTTTVGVAISDLNASVQAAIREDDADGAAVAAQQFAEAVTSALDRFSDELRAIDPPDSLTALHDEEVAAATNWVAVIERLSVDGVESLADVERILGHADFMAATDRMNRSCMAMREAAAENGIEVVLNCESATPSSLLPAAAGGGSGGDGGSGGTGGTGAGGGSSAGGGGGRDSVSVILGALNETDGLNQVNGHESHAEPSERAGRSCRELLTNGGLVRWAYFQIDDGISGTTTPLEVVIEYFDEGDFRWWVEYDGPADAGRSFAEAAATVMEGTQTWRTHTFRLPDANFGKSDYVLTEAGIDVDFRIAAADVPVSLCVREVTLRTQGPTLRIRIVTTSDWASLELPAALVRDVRMVEPDGLEEGW